MSHRPPLDAWDLVVATCEGSWKFSAGRSDDEWLFNDWLFGYDVKLVPAYSPFVNHEIPSRWGVPGLTRANAHGTRIIAFSYWLVVTIFATFYTVLKYVYRKRPESPPCKN
ncbi:hypothetical protein [Fuerstiella marisgermanici]|uniref:hypothetical protein n=1 Tax=Fuerstiella marisgermanici TaxID=1891926 RepID=UPI0011AB40B2|nr:hypothetical protein [Fuerstiella marisgermanici]